MVVVEAVLLLPMPHAGAAEDAPVTGAAPHGSLASVAEGGAANIAIASTAPLVSLRLHPSADRNLPTYAAAPLPPIGMPVPAGALRRPRPALAP